MERRFRELFESIAYIGLKPRVRQPQQPKSRDSRLGALRVWLDSMLTGRASSDPLCVSNRTPAQKIKTAIVVALPFAALAIIFISALTPKPDSVATPVSDKATAALSALPDFNPAVNLNTRHDVEVLEARIERGGQLSLAGSVRNNTEHSIREAEAVIDLTDASGTQLGGVRARVENLPPRGTADFRLPIQQTDAAFALVREIRSQ